MIYSAGAPEAMQGTQLYEHNKLEFIIHRIPSPDKLWFFLKTGWLKPGRADTAAAPATEMATF